MISKKLLIVGLMSSAVMLAGCSKEAEKKDDSTKLTTMEQKMNYAIAHGLASNLKQNGLPIEPEVFSLAMIDVRDGVDSRLTEEEINSAMQSAQEMSMAKRAADQQKYLDEGKAFLEQNKAKEGVVTTESGLQYKVITEGTGVKPKATDTVSVNYVGKLVDGTEFDKSESHGGPVSFEVGGVIPGWTEALTMMPQGSKWELTIPSELAYGAGSSGPIPANSVLVFEIELLEVKAAAAEEPKAKAK